MFTESSEGQRFSSIQLRISVWFESLAIQSNYRGTQPANFGSRQTYVFFPVKLGDIETFSNCCMQPLVNQSYRTFPFLWVNLLFSGAVFHGFHRSQQLEPWRNPPTCCTCKGNHASHGATRPGSLNASDFWADWVPAVLWTAAWYPLVMTNIAIENHNC